MKNKVLQAAVVLMALGCFAVSTGDTVEIETFLNARSSANFLKATHNVQFVLKKGEQGKVVGVHRFPKSGNSGLQIVVQSGPHKGKTVWVLYNPKQDPAYVALVDKNQASTRAPEQAASATTLRNTPAVQDPVAPQLQPQPPAPIAAAAPSAPSDDETFRQVAKIVGNQADVLSGTQQDAVRCAASSAVPAETPEAWTVSASSQIQASDPEIVQLSKQLTQGLTSDRDKALAIHDWLIGKSGIVYDEKGLEEGTFKSTSDALTVLHRKTGVCGGFSNLNAALLRAAGIPAKVVYGQFVGSSQEGMTPDEICRLTNPYDGSAHGWNQVYVDGHWINEDVTSDAGSYNVDLTTNTSGWKATPNNRSNFDPNPAFFPNLKCGDIQD